jgi:hypothetical protein
MIMSNRKARLAVYCAIAVQLAAASAHGWGSPSRTTLLTFSGPVALPGATLGTGTYVFELLNPSSGADVVTVMDKGRSRVYYSGFTRRVDRPTGQVQPVSLAEAPRGVPPKILVWYPTGEGMGHQFIYR